eukprot:TRINITY_DN2012_c0_g2_i1.p2 TRINITY_DN2012_c0_g2~~TRINITY_DN2012_c0_g2_i1.p2  ORF type:complete len:194 (-),score=47.78 TRINITY_DN2012_c0_g2_i1:260-841(-)
MKETQKMLLKNYKAKIYTVQELTLNGRKEVVVMTQSELLAEMTNVLNVERKVTSRVIVVEEGQAVLLVVLVVVDEEEEEDEAEEDILETEVALQGDEVGVAIEVDLQERRVGAEAQVVLEVVTEALAVIARAEVEVATEVPPSQEEMTGAAARVAAGVEAATGMLGLQLPDLHHIPLAGPEAEVAHQKSENVL